MGGLLNKLAIVIVNFGARTLAERCIESLRAQGVTSKVIVVDNTPEPEFQAVRGDDLEVIATGVNGGFAAGCNLGLKRAWELDLDYVLLLNPDTQADQDFVTPLLDVLENNPGIGAISPKIVDESDVDRIQYSGGVISWWRGGPRHITEDSSGEVGWRETDFISGCSMLLRVAATKQVGLMDEGYFLYFEDADYVEALKASGWKIAYLPQVYVKHALSATTGFQSENYVYYFSRNRLIYLSRWSSSVARWVYYAIHFGIKWPATFILFGVKKGKWNLAAVFIQGAFAAIRGEKGPRQGTMAKINPPRETG